MANNACNMSLTSILIVVLTFSSLSRSEFAERAPLCQSPGEWMVDQDGLATKTSGSFNPIVESMGNVSVIFLLKAAESMDQVQATRIRDMVNFLRSTGLTDIKFFIVNSRDPASFEKRSLLMERVSGSEIQVYQETDIVSIWDKLKGSRGDLFIYDRCGRLTYYIPSPLSVLSARAPIAQATILSAYFDNPCGSSCSHQPTTVSSPHSTTFDATERTNTTDGIIDGSENFTDDVSDLTTLDPIEDPNSPSINLPDVQLQVMTNVGLNGSSIQERRDMGDQRNGQVMLQPWKIFEFFLNPSNVTSTESNQTESYETTSEVSLVNETTQELGRSDVEDIVTSPMTNIETVTRSPPKCEASQCVEFSTDSVLRARLCCLREEVGSDGEATTGCRTYTRTTCSQMLPLIKCCLKDFSQLLANYFRSRSNGRKRKNPGYVG